MSNASKLDQELFMKYRCNLERLACDAAEIQGHALPKGMDKIVETKIRIGQQYFRRSVLAAYDGRCCITGISEPDLLVASHIKPWKDSDPEKERTNPCNGLALNGLHDRAFDKGLITIDPDYRVVVSTHLKNCEMPSKTRTWLMSFHGEFIFLPKQLRPCHEFLEYHNSKIFLG